MGSEYECCGDTDEGRPKDPANDPPRALMATRQDRPSPMPTPSRAEGRRRTSPHVRGSPRCSGCSSPSFVDSDRFHVGILSKLCLMVDRGTNTALRRTGTRSATTTQEAAGVDAAAAPCDDPVDAGVLLDESDEPVLGVAVSVLVVDESDEPVELPPVPFDGLESFL